MAKLYPPYIEGTIPAFTGTTIVVPFSLNRANSTTDIAGFSLRIKTVQNNITLDTLEQTDSGYIDLTDKFQVTFTINETLQSKLTIGQFYKVQLAFLSNNSNNNGLDVGYYSTVGIIKYTTIPDLGISGLKTQKSSDATTTINRHNYKYLGFYSQKDGDSTEKLYSSRFILTNSKDEVILDSGDIIHNSSYDTSPYESFEDYVISRELPANQSFYLQFVATTINKLVAASPKYRIMQQNSVKPELNADVIANVNFEDAYIDVSLVGHLNKRGEETHVTGSFVLSRAASNTDWAWENIMFFTLQAQKPTRFLWRDFTVEQGVQYQYAVQQYNDNELYSARIKSEIVTADFEDAFLFDGTRQLKIRFNPKVASFKNNIPEQKIDTIGSKYPYIFRNGKVHYKEFPISGLISYQMDDNKMFYAIEERENISATPNDLVSENIHNERDFKLEVLEWLNDGKLKIFKSPTEGNYFVRLMNVSLSPIDPLGRMLHSFNCTAYEMYNYNYNNLVNQNFINVYIQQTKQIRFLTVELTGKDSTLADLIASLENYANAGVNVVFTEQQHAKICNHTYSKDSNFDYSALFSRLSGTTNYYIPAATIKAGNNLAALQDINENTILYLTGRINQYPIYSVQIADMVPGTRLTFILDDRGTTESIQINATGKYHAEFTEPIVGINVDKAENINLDNMTTGIQGSITYGYYSTATNIFNTIADVSLYDVPIKQFFGTPSKTYYSIDDTTMVTTNNLIEVLEDIKRDISQIFFINFYSRPIKNIYFKDNRESNFTLTALKNKVYYWDMDCTEPIDVNTLAPNYIYAICRARYDYTYTNDVLFEQYYIDSNLSRGYYVDTFGRRIEAFLGYYLDGKSDQFNTIIFKDSYDLKQVTINKDTIDLRQTEQFLLPAESGIELTKVTFGNGVMCEISYQYSEITYLIEQTSELIKSRKVDYEKYYSYWIELHQSAEAQTSFENMPGLQNPDTSLNSFVAYESNSDTLINLINTSYQGYIDFLALSLKQYREEHEEL